MAADRIGEIIDALQAHFIITEGIGLELHPDHVTVEILTVLKAAGVTKISIAFSPSAPNFRATSEEGRRYRCNEASAGCGEV